MSVIDRNSYKYKQIKPCITIMTKTDIKRIFLRGTIGEGLACVGWVCRGGAGPCGPLLLVGLLPCFGRHGWVLLGGVCWPGCGIYTAVLSLV